MLDATDISVLLVHLNDALETYKKNKCILGEILESVIHQRGTIHRFVAPERENMKITAPFQTFSPWKAFRELHILFMQKWQKKV